MGIAPFLFSEVKRRRGRRKTVKMKVRLVMAAIAAISSATCLGGLFDNALKAVSDTAKAVTASPAETVEEAERARLKAVQEESERKEE